MVQTKALLLSLFAATTSLATPLTSQERTQWQEIEKSSALPPPRTITVQQDEPTSLLQNLMRSKTSRLRDSTSKKSIIWISHHNNPQHTPETQTPPPTHQPRPTTLSEEIEAYTDPSPKNHTPCPRILALQRKLARKMFVAQEKRLVRIGKGRVVWAVLREGRWVVDEGVLNVSSGRREGGRSGDGRVGEL
ncbi:hypothetical protein HYFRA_00002917 [Hymenoscyphus fraxineus]|uniref:Uncharacterized protein n=1 Tax=Hymenoscyphus fraxineus TaxID=746836 RepID=A0A9N9PQQ3_9HELO|nr:hypothetical protein HYFRA_00002917 [Hymenoscyphus fraxineus]